jgi:hypothetical protein
VKPDCIEERRAAAAAALRLKGEDDFIAFACSLVIPSAYGPRLLADCIADFQLEAFRAIAPALHALKERRRPKCRRFWWERTKGASKDADAAIVLLWLVAFCEWPLYGQVGAADREQAGIVKRRAEMILHENPWLRDRIEVVGSQIRGIHNTARIDVLAADTTGGAHGETPDFLLLNELSHVKRWKFIQDLMDNAQKVPMGVVLAATNAGFTGTDAERWKKIAENSSLEAGHWWYQVIDYPAPWIGKDDLADAKDREMGSRFDRLWWGVWTSGKGDALTENRIKDSIRLPGPADGPEGELIYIGGLDLGVNNDHAGVVLIGFSETLQLAKLAYCRDFPPVDLNGRDEVDLRAVRDTVQMLHARFAISWMGYDPHQAALMSQELRLEHGVPMEAVNFTSKNLDMMATLLVDAFRMSRLWLYDDDHLINDLKKLVLTERTYGFRLEATRDATGHADVATALVISLLGCFGAKGIETRLDELTVGTRETMRPMDDKELAALPDDLRDIVEDARRGYGKWSWQDDVR